MRWFKHLSVAQRDPDMQLLISEFGYEGYGVFWGILETLSENLNSGSQTSVKLPVKSWKNPAISDKKWMKIVQFLAKNEKISVEFSEKSATIKCDKLLKYRDEYKEKRDREAAKKSR